MNLIEYPDTGTLMTGLATRLQRELREALLTGPATLAVPGGSPPGPMFDALSEADIDWSKVTVMLTDERQVPADHERSNERLVRGRLLQNRAAAATFLRLVPEGDDIATPIAALAAMLPITVLVLGMGADMHTASLFPGSPDLAAALSDLAPPLMASRSAFFVEAGRATVDGSTFLSVLPAWIAPRRPALGGGGGRGAS